MLNRDEMILAAHEEFNATGECVEGAVKRDDIMLLDMNESAQYIAERIIESKLTHKDITDIRAEFDQLVESKIIEAVDDCIYEARIERAGL